MEALQIMPVMAQRRNSNLGEFAEDATLPWTIQRENDLCS